MAEDKRSGEQALTEDGLEVRPNADGSADVYCTPYGCEESDLTNLNTEKAWRVLRGFIHDCIAMAILHEGGSSSGTETTDIGATCRHGHQLHSIRLNEMARLLSEVWPGGKDAFLTAESLQAAVKHKIKQLRDAAEAQEMLRASATQQPRERS